MITDEFNNVWHVGAGDPARPLVLLLNQRGFVDIKLPFAVLCGTMSPNQVTSDDKEMAACLSVLTSRQLPPGLEELHAYSSGGLGDE